MKLLQSRALRYAFFGIVLIIMVVVGMELQWAHRQSSLAKEWRSEMVSSLTSSDSYEEIESTLSHLGVMLGEEDDAWVAIDYRDTHNKHIVSSAVARMMNGELFVSEEHFCGKLSGYKSAKKQVGDIEGLIGQETDPNNIDEYKELLSHIQESLDSYPKLKELEIKSDLVRQRELLFELGFGPIESEPE